MPNIRELKILIADDHPLILKGMKEEFHGLGFSSIFEAWNGAEALQIINKQKLDLVILDVDMPIISGLEVAQKLQGQPIKIIIVTHHKEDGYIIQAKLLGVNAYLLKEDPFSEILTAVNQVFKSDFYLSTSFHTEKTETLDLQIKRLNQLSLAEREVIKRISEGFETADVASILSVSKRTIHKHRSNIITKLALSSDRNALQEFATENRFLIKELFQ